jgi:hypothetical protein
MKEWPPVFKAKISYVLATEENTRPVIITQTQQQQPEIRSKSWFSFMFKTKPVKQGMNLMQKKTTIIDILLPLSYMYNALNIQLVYFFLLKFLFILLYKSN